MRENRPVPWNWSSVGFVLDAHAQLIVQNAPGAVSDHDGRLLAAAPEMADILRRVPCSCQPNDPLKHRKECLYSEAQVLLARVEGRTLDD
jgi:hypothetical protein